MGGVPKENKRDCSCGYLREIEDEYPPFLRDEEIAFRRKMLAEGRYKDLRDEMVLRNVGLVKAYGKGWARFYSAEDAVSIGITGLYEAAAVFDWTREDVRFGTFAGWYIKKNMNACLDKYFSRVDEASARWDAPVASDDSDETCCLGDLLTRLVDPEALAVCDDPDGLTRVEELEKWAFRMMDLGNGGRYDPESFARCRRIIAQKIADPDRTLADRGREAGITRERVRQLDLKAMSIVRKGVRRVAAERLRLAAPKIEDFAGAGGTRPSLDWNPKTRKYDVVDKPAYRAAGDVNWDAWGRARALFDKKVDAEADRYLFETFGVRFSGLTPVRRKPVRRKPSAVSARYAAIADRLEYCRKSRFGGGAKSGK